VRLFEAAACGVPILSDSWPGLDEFFKPGKEILVAVDADSTTQYLRDCDPGYLQHVAVRARARVLAEHTGAHRACQLEEYVREVSGTTPVLSQMRLECGA
jgi:spore maturation protein CgeB